MEPHLPHFRTCRRVATAYLDVAPASYADPPAQEKAFNAAFVDGVMSPAELEMLAADADSIDDLVEALQAQF